MAATLYHDNDADLIIRKIPPTATVQWAVVNMTDVDDFPVTPIHADLSGTLTYSTTGRRFEGVLEGDDITQHLPPTDPITLTPMYGIVYWWGQNVRKVIPDITVKVRRI
jgi:hypothetical protein